MALSDLEKTFAVNPFGKQVGIDRKPESTEDVKLEISEKVNSVFEEYKKAYKEAHPYLFGPVDKINEYISSLKLNILSPLEIDLTLQLIIPSAFNYIPGIFVSRLINDSYGAGNNNFHLTLRDCIIDNIFSKVKATEENPVIASVFGNVGKFLGDGSEHCAIDVQGTAGKRLGYTSKDCTYNIFGNVGHCCGEYSKDSNYNINGNAEGSFFGVNSENCTYNIKGKIKGWISSDVKNSTFKVLNEENYGLLVYKLPETNTVQLLNLSGGIIMETKK